MSSSSLVVDLLERAKRTGTTHEPSLLFPDMIKSEKIPHTVIVSCADPRVIPEKIFHLKPEDNVIVFRTIAGHPQPIWNGILALDHALRIDDILVLHHTDCGSTYWTEEEVRQGLTKRCPGHASAIGRMIFGATENSPEENLKEDAMWLKRSPIMREELAKRVRAFMWDIQTGKLEEVY